MMEQAQIETQDSLTFQCLRLTKGRALNSACANA